MNGVKFWRRKVVVGQFRAVRSPLSPYRDNRRVGRTETTVNIVRGEQTELRESGGGGLLEGMQCVGN